MKRGHVSRGGCGRGERGKGAALFAPGVCVCICICACTCACANAQVDAVARPAVCACGLAITMHRCGRRPGYVDGHGCGPAACFHAVGPWARGIGDGSGGGSVGCRRRADGIRAAQAAERLEIGRVGWRGRRRGCFDFGFDSDCSFGFGLGFGVTAAKAMAGAQGWIGHYGRRSR